MLSKLSRVHPFVPALERGTPFSPVKLLRKTTQAALAVSVVLLVTFMAAALTYPRLPGQQGGSAVAAEWVGVLHVHTTASHDGGGTLDQVVAAAASVGLDFVLLTDHNNRVLPTGSYRDSVLLVVGEEVNTPYGHLVVAGGSPVGDRRASGPAAAAAAAGSVREPGNETPVVVPGGSGLRIAAHPTGASPWRVWEAGHFDGIEIWNADTDWRDDPTAEFLHALSLVPLRPLAGLNRLLDYPEEALRLWDRQLEERFVFGVCGVDAHNSLPLNRSRSLDLHFPRYTQSFMLAQQHVQLDSAPTGDAEGDAARVLRALADGRSYCSFPSLGEARGARFEVKSGDETATLGGRIPWTERARAVVTLPPAGTNASLRLLQDGRVVAEGEGMSWEVLLPGAGVYRLEVWLDWGRPVPWILTNPILVGVERPR